MDPRLTPQPVNRNPRMVRDINSPVTQSLPRNPFTGLAHPPAAKAVSSPPPAPPVASPVQPAAAPASPPPASAAVNPFKAEVVASIPVAQQGQPVSPASPVSLPPTDNKDDELDKILEAVNNRVKAPATPAPAKPKPTAAIAQKVRAGGGLVKQKVGTSKPVGAIVATLMVAVMLAATAVVAYRQGAHNQVGASTAKVGTTSSASSSIQEAGNLLVRPSDLDDYSQSLQTKIDGLNDSQDFSQQPLTDKMLGL